MVSIAFAAVVVAAVGCGNGDSDDSSGGGTEDLSGQKATFVTFGGTEDPDIRAAFAEPVAEKTGLDISFDSPTDYVKLQTQVRSGNVTWTVAMADPWFSIQKCGELLASVPDSVDTSGIDPKYQVDDCGVAGDTFSFNIIYNADEFGDDPPTSWADFFDTQKYPGKRGIWGSYVVNGVLEGALLADGVDREQVYPLDIDRAITKLDTIRDDIAFFDTLAQGEQLMSAGEVSMIVTVSTSGFHLNENGENWAPIWTDAIESWDYYVAPEGANLDDAAALLSQIASPDAQRALAESIPAGWTVKDIDPPPAQSKEIELWTPTANSEGLLQLDQEWWAENYEQANSIWLEWVAG